MRPGGAQVAAPIDDHEYDRLMAALGPFENAPRIAIAVSGGSDSLCLAHLTRRWAARQGGAAIGLVVDHGLRAEAHEEAKATARQLETMGIAPHVLRWTGQKPRRGVQARARAARYDLLLDWCRGHAVIHLALGHHAGDQAETLLFRRRAGSGDDGLAAMAALAERRGVRILRPLLATRPERLRATLAAAGLSWIDDPSNRDLRYTRTRVRREIATAGTLASLRADAHRFGTARAARDHRIARMLAETVRLFPTGHAVVDVGVFAGADPDDGRQGLARIVACIGARPYPPRRARLEALYDGLVHDRLAGGRTLGGCVFRALDGGAILIAREAAAAAHVLSPRVGEPARWDNRFDVLVETQGPQKNPFSVRRLDDAAWGALRKRFPAAAKALAAASGTAALPAPARRALPVLCDLDGPLALPHLPNQSLEPAPGGAMLSISFRPRKALAGASFVTGDG